MIKGPLARKATHRLKIRQGPTEISANSCRVRDGELWLIGADIPEYKQAAHWNHDPRRPRKLLVHKREMRKFANQAHEKGLTLVPLKMYFNDRGVAKVLMLCCH